VKFILSFFDYHQIINFDTNPIRINHLIWLQMVDVSSAVVACSLCSSKLE